MITLDCSDEYHFFIMIFMLLALAELTGLCSNFSPIINDGKSIFSTLDDKQLMRRAKKYNPPSFFSSLELTNCQKLTGSLDWSDDWMYPGGYNSVSSFIRKLKSIKT